MPSRLTNKTRVAVAPLLFLALNNAQVGVVVKADDGSYLYASGLPDYFPEIEVSNARDADLFEGDWLPKIEQAQQTVIESGDKVVLELSRTTVSQFCVCECTIQRYESEGIIPALLITFMDLTPERKRADTLKALLREVSHRSKNLLAIVQSIAAQTAYNSDGLDAFVMKFRGRLAALSASQDLVTESNWRGASFKQLASLQLLRYVEKGDSRVQVLGDDPMLSPNGATHVGLALHELITNSIAFGALSSEHGKLTLHCKADSDGDFVIDWDEKTEVEAQPETGLGNYAFNRKHFGSTVLERVVPSALNGQAEYNMSPGHVSYRLSFSTL